MRSVFSCRFGVDTLRGMVLILICGYVLPNCRSGCTGSATQPYVATVGPIVNGRRYVQVRSGVLCAPIVIKEIDTWIVPDDWSGTER